MEKTTAAEEAMQKVKDGDYEGAVATLFAAWSADRANLDLAIAYACLLTSIDRENEAEELFSALAEESPADSRIWNNWGFLLLQRGDVMGAIPRLEKALELSPADFEALVNLGIALDRNGRTAEAIRLYRQAVTVNPESSVVYNNLGTALWRSGEAEEALAAFRNAILYDPRDASANNNLGIIKLSQGHYREAAEFFRLALEIEPSGNAARHNLKAAEAALKEDSNRDKTLKPDVGRKKKCPEPPTLF